MNRLLPRAHVYPARLPPRSIGEAVHQPFITTKPTAPSKGAINGVAPHDVVADTDGTSVENERIELLVRRDGKAAAKIWVERTLKIYRRTLTDETGYASLPQYRTLFEGSIRAFEFWLGTVNPSDNMGRASGSPVVALEHPRRRTPDDKGAYDFEPIDTASIGK